MIAKWKLKAIVQKSISYLPNKEKINFWFQKNVTKGAHLNDQYFVYKIEHARDHLRFFKTYSEKELASCNVLELGTGWYPIVPIALFLNDVKNIHSLDLMDWMTAENVQLTCRKFIEWREKGKLEDYLPFINEEKWAVIRNIASNENQYLEEICQNIQLVKSLGDARNTSFADSSFDLICSNNTFEHIPKSILTDILKEFRRVIKPRGVMSHFIDLSDHFAHADSSINAYNFLRYSEKKWQQIDNSIQPQNRLRFADYRAMYKNLALPITEEEVREGNQEELASIPLAEMFQKYDMAELAISHAYIVSKLHKKE